MIIFFSVWCMLLLFFLLLVVFFFYTFLFLFFFFFFFSSRRRHTRFDCDWSSDVCSSDLSDKEAAAERLTEIGRRQLRHLAHMVDDLLDVSRITTNKITLRRERVDPRSEERRVGKECRSRWSAYH